MKGNKTKWQEAKIALKTAGIDISSGSYPSEIIGGWGGRLDVRDFGPKGKIDREVYYIDAAVKQLQQAQDILQQIGLKVIEEIY